MKQKILHFNNYGHTALTIASQEVSGFPNYYVLGMALAHKKDNGSRRVGRALAINYLQEGLDEPLLIPHIKTMETPVIGTTGHYIVKGLDTIKKIVAWLRYTERYYANSKVNSLFHKAFFHLPDLWESYIKYDTTI